MSVGTLNINGTDIDLDKSVIVPLTFAIADARNPDKKKGSGSKIIDIVGTQNNLDFFFSTWNLSLSDERDNGIGFNYDPTIRYDASYTQNNETVFRGASSLHEVSIKDGVYTFSVILYSDIINVYQRLGDMTLPELDWSVYNETLSVANIEASWISPVGTGILWPHIDFGFTDDLLSYKTNELFPYVWVKEVYEKAYALLGLTIDSTFFESANFKNLCIGTGGGDQILISPTEVANRRSSHSADGSISETILHSSITSWVSDPFTGAITYRTIFTFNINIPIQDTAVVTTSLIDDPLPQFSGSLGRITAANTGTYNLVSGGTFPYTSVFTGGAPTSTSGKFNIRLDTKRNGAIIDSSIDVVSGSGSLIVARDINIHLITGDIIEFEFTITAYLVSADAALATDIPDTFDFTFDLDNTFVFDLTSIQAEIIDGDTVNVSTFLPALKVSEILKGFNKAFDLVTSDPSDTGVVKIEPSDTFYKNTSEAIEMSDKVDYSKKIKIQPASNIEGKVYKFKFANDMDHYKALHFEQYGKQYGDYDYEVPSTFKDGERVYQLPFAQSIPVEIAGTELIIPRIISFDEVNQVSKPFKGKARVFYYQGLKTLPTTTWDLVNSNTGAISTQTQTPSVHHLNDLTTPTFDFNFGVPEVVYYTATAYTTFNLFSGYNERLLRELTGRDAKLLSLYVKLNQRDLQGEFLRELWNIKGVIYRINTIIDYNANAMNNVTTLVELIRINKGKSPSTYTLPTAFLPLKSSTVVNEWPNTVKSSGTGNTIDPTAKNVLVSGDNNTIAADLKNVTVFGDGQTVSISDVFVLMATFYNLDFTTNKIATKTADFTMSNLIDFYIVDTTAGDIDIVVPSGDIAVGKIWVFKKTVAANSFHFKFPILIDGVSQVSVKDINESISIWYDGTTFKISTNERDTKTLDADAFPTFDTAVVLADLNLIIADLEALPGVIAHANAFITETLTPGVYQTPGAASITGTLTLDGTGFVDPIFVIRATGAMTVAAASSVVLINALPENVHILADAACSLGAGAIINGNMICKLGAPSAGAGCTIVGRMLTLNGAVSADSTNLSLPTATGVTIDYRSCINMIMFTGLTTVSNVGTSTYTGDIASNNGAITGFGSPTVVNGTIYPAGISTPDQNNYLPVETGGDVTFGEKDIIVYIFPSGAVNFKGFDAAGFVDNHSFILFNLGAGDATLKRLDSGSASDNQIAVDADVILPQYQGVEVIRRNGTLNKWLIIGNN